MLEDLLSSCCCLSKNRHQHTPQQKSTTNVGGSRSDSAVAGVSGNFSRLSLQELNEATAYFHERNKLGGGGFGSVYKGVLPDGTIVAVKKLCNASKQGVDEFINEVNLLTTVQHRNLIKLLGCCAERSERILVYEYVQNRSLDKCLFGSRGRVHLDWRVRRAIIMGTAKGLLYLHHDSRVRIIHRDIKLSNILLDDKFCPKIADFGLAKLFDIEQTHAITKVAGTFGYLAPEYVMSGKLTEKADIFSFGVVMLEIMGGRKNTNLKLPAKNQRLLEVAWRFYNQGRSSDLVDPRLGDDFDKEEATRMIHVALLCTQVKPDLRPSMSKVVILLSGHSPIAEQPTRPPFVSEVGAVNHSRKKKLESPTYET